MKFSKKIETLPEQMLGFLAQKNIVITENTPLLLTLSGGVDSSVLANLFFRLKKPFHIAHVNFKLRDSSDEDEKFVKSLAKKYGVPFYCKYLDVTSHQKKFGGSIQMIARTLRYEWFKELCKENDLKYLATAHHLNDSLETLTRNLSKGTGIAGLCGIPPKRDKIIRPLLFCSKKTILDYAQKENLTWREDLSNKSLKYDRNRIRNKVIPLLKEINPSIESTLFSTLKRINQTSKLAQERMDQCFKKFYCNKTPYPYLITDELLRLTYAPLLLESWLKPLGFNIKQIQPWIDSPPQAGKNLKSKSHSLVSSRGRWIIVPNKKNLQHEHKLKYNVASLQIKEHFFDIKTYKKTNFLPYFDKKKALLDKDKLTFPLTIRNWKEGDRWTPLTKNKPFTQLVSKFLINKKVPLPMKKETLVVLSKNQIIWIVGLGISNSFKLTEETKQIYQLTLLDKKE